MIKTLLLASIVFSHLFLFAANEYAITTTNLNLRESSSKNSTSLKILNQGDTLEILSSDPNWTKVKVDNLEGFVSTIYVSIISDNQETNSDQELTSDQKSNRKVFLIVIIIVLGIGLIRWFYQKDVGGGDLILIIVVFLMLAFSAVILLLFLICASIYYTIKFKKKYSKISGTYSDFWLDDLEKEEFKKLYELQADANKMIIDADQTAEDHELSRNKDGRISSRSTLGKKLLEEISENRDVLKVASSRLDYLSRKPKRQWEEFCELYKYYFAYRISSIAYIFALPIICQFKYFKLSIQDAFLFGYNLFRGFYEKYFGIGKYVYKENLFGLILVAGIALFSYFVAKHVSIRLANKLTPITPEIDIDNLDKI